MILIAVSCPHCGSNALVRNGHAPNGKQKYFVGKSIGGRKEMVLLETPGRMIPEGLCVISSGFLKRCRDWAMLKADAEKESLLGKALPDGPHGKIENANS